MSSSHSDSYGTLQPSKLDISASNASLSTLVEDDNSPLLKPVKRSGVTNAEKLSVYMVLLALLIAESTRGMVIPTMTPYILHLGGDAADIGIAVSVFSIGKLLSAAPLGYFTEWTGSTRLALILTALISAFGNMMYGMAYLTGSMYVLLFSRFLLGLSTGVMGIGRAFMAAAAISEVSKSLDGDSPLAKYISYSGLVQYVGFSLTPIVSAIIGSFRIVPQSLFLNLIGVSKNAGSYTISTLASEFGFSSTGYTLENPEVSVPIIECILPAYFLAFLNILLVVLLLIYMTPLDPNVEQSPQPSKEDENIVISDKTPLLDSSSSSVTSVTKIEEPPELVDQFALNIAFLVFFYMNFAIRGIIGVVEALAPLQYQYIVGDIPTVSRDSAVYFTALGILGLITFLSLDPVLKATKIHANYMLAIGIALIGFGSMFMIPQIHGGKLEVFTAGMVMVWSIGSPLCQTLTILSLSLLVGKKPQAVIMSYLTNAGSLGRILFPLLAGFLPTPGIEICDIILCALSLVFALWYHRWLELRIENNRKRIMAKTIDC